MKEALCILINDNGLTICHPQRPDLHEFVGDHDADVGERLLQFRTRHGLLTIDRIILFVAESLLFFKAFELPANTVDIEEAVGYQLGLLTPFDPQKLIYGHSTVRGKEVCHVTLYALAKSMVEHHLNAIVAAGFSIIGLYPEHARFVAKGQQPAHWALIIPEPGAKIFVLKGTHLEKRLVCMGEVGFEDLLMELGTETVFHPQPPEASGYRQAEPAPFDRLALKEFNLLPSMYRQPEYSRLLMLALVVLNLLAIVTLVGGKEFRVRSLNHTLDQEIVAIKPQVSEVLALRDKEKQLETYIDKFNVIANNPDIIGLLSKLTLELPHSAYLDQINMDKGGQAVSVRGYTEDITGLTSKLQGLGDAKLKSTSRRRNKTYFEVEISLQ